MILRRLLMAAATVAAGAILSEMVAKATRWQPAGAKDYDRSRVTPLRQVPRRRTDRSRSQVDETSDSSFPASDPPARY
jgi:hypothetical protein